MPVTPARIPPTLPDSALVTTFDSELDMPENVSKNAEASCHPSDSVSAPRREAVSLMSLNASLIPWTFWSIILTTLANLSRDSFAFVPSLNRISAAFIIAFPLAIMLSPRPIKFSSPILRPSSRTFFPSAILLAAMVICSLASEIFCSAIPFRPPLRNVFLGFVSFDNCSSSCLISLAYSLASIAPLCRASLIFCLILAPIV